MTAGGVATAAGSELAGAGAAGGGEGAAVTALSVLRGGVPVPTQLRVSVGSRSSVTVGRRAHATPVTTSAITTTTPPLHMRRP